MKVLLCGGIKTASIAKELKPRFKTGGVEFLVEQDISNIASLFTRGEYFDRAVILEQGWTNNGTDTNEFSIRQKIANFISVVSTKDSRDATCIFVATSKEMAQMAAEESIEIVNQCVVLVKKPPYTYTFCADLATTNLDQFDKSIVYRIDEQETAEESTEDIIWSQDHGPEVDDTGYTLGTVPELKFNDITVEDTQSSEETLGLEDDCGLDISDFDNDIFGDDDGADTTDFDTLGDAFKSGDEGEEEGLIKEEKEGYIMEKGSAESPPIEIDEGDIADSGLDEPDKLDDILGGFDDNDGFDDDNGLDEPLEIEDEPLEIEDEPLEIEDEPLEIEDEPLEIEDEPLEIEDEPEEIENEPLEIEDVPLEIEDEPEESGETLVIEKEPLEIEEPEETLTINDTLDDLFGTEDDIAITEPKVEEPDEIDLAGLFGTNKETEEDPDADVPQQFRKEMYKRNEKQIVQEEQEKQEEAVQKKSKLSFGKKKSKQSKGQEQSSKSELSSVMSMLNTFKNRGSSLVVTGTPCSGTSTLVFNIANTIVSLGYTVLIVDMDTINRTQAFMSKEAYEAVHSLDPENASLKQALNAVNNGIGKYVNIIKPGFHVLTMGLAGDIVTGEKLAPKQKLARFSSNVRNNYNFIIYDIPFNMAVDYAADITFTADNIVLACEASNHGVMAMMLAMCNIESEDMQEALFGRAQLCMTKYTGLKRILDSNVSNVRDILNRIDKEVQSLLGIDPEYYFSNLGICGLMRYDTRYEDGWFSETAYSDLSDGKDEYIKLLTSILLKK